MFCVSYKNILTKGIRIKILVALTIIIFSSNLFASGNCNFYLKEEMRRHCVEKKRDSSDYYSNYGYFYCRKFNSLLSETKNNKLTNFINITRPCLQKALNNEEIKKRSCQYSESHAFKSHPKCYIEGGYCKLDKQERLKVMSLVAGMNLIYKIEESLLQYMAVQKGCYNNNEHVGILESFKIIYEDLKNINNIGKEKIIKIFFSTPKTVESTVIFFQKAVSILKYGSSTETTNALASQYLKLKYNKTISTQTEECFKTLMEDCFKQQIITSGGGEEFSGVSDLALAIRRKPLDINQKLEKISNLKEK